MILAGKVAIVTGGSRGIGEAIAATLAGSGAAIALVARGRDDLAAVAARIGARGGRAVPFPCDLRRAADIKSLVAAIAREFDRIDILVNNAGATRNGTLLERADEDWLDAYDAKIHAFVRMCRECWPHLQASRGRIVNIAGALAKTPNPDAVIGSTLAASVVSLTKALAEFGRDHGIVVNAVNPGLIETGRLRRHLAELGRNGDRSGDEERARVIARLGLERFGTPQDVADVVAFLLSERAAYIQGAVIDVDGGLTKGL
jgi:NAD(P)-dependent dehydrogenase (short-subunit alcohol dehydrogenase family)